MRTFIGTCLAVALLTSTTIAQNSSKAAPNHRPIAKRVFMISGDVSDDGTTFVSDEINKWVVTNAVLLKGYTGAHVTVRCHVDPDKHAMQVLSIVPQELVRYNPGDAAFRR
jgi:hypothetical protein